MIKSFVIENRAKCKGCGDIVVSKSVWDYTSCACGKIAVDGGQEYMRRVGDLDLIYENSLMGLERHRRLIEDYLAGPRLEGSPLDDIEQRLPGKVWRCQGSFTAGRPEVADDPMPPIEEVACGHFEAASVLAQSRVPRQELHQLIERARYAARCEEQRRLAADKPFQVRGNALQGFVEIELDQAQVSLQADGRAKVYLTAQQVMLAQRGQR